MINAVLKEPLKLELLNVFGGGDQEWATIELKAESVCKNGEFSAEQVAVTQVGRITWRSSV